MSYSFVVSAATKAQAEINVRSEMAKVVASQPMHKHDQEAACAAAKAMIDILADEPNKTIQVSVSGWLSWLVRDQAEPISAANVAVTASLVAPELTV